MPLASDFSAALRRARLKAKGRSLPEVRERAKQRIAAELEYRGLTEVGEPSDSAFWRRLIPSIAADVDRDPELLHNLFCRRAAQIFFAGAADARTTALHLQREHPAFVGRLLESADRIREGRFDLLGYSDLSFGTPIDWHLDPTTGIRSPRRHWSRIHYLDPAVSGDHKVVWELNRHQYFMVLGRAYQVSGREEYAETFVEHVTSWMNENSPKDGVNWASSLEIAYRLIAWLWALEFFRQSPRLIPAVRLRMLKFLYVHARHLERYLSTYFSPNTHLTGEALGLWYAGLLLPEFQRAAEWARVGWLVLTSQIEQQVYPDGVYFEQATYYQRYTVDIYLHAVLLAQNSGRPVPEPMLQRLDAAVDHLADLTRPDGSLPLIGDDDGGRLVALEERECSDARATLATAAVVFQRSKYAFVAGCVPEETLWLVGVDRARALAGLGSQPPASGSRAFTVGGYVIMRDGWHDAANHAVMDCGPHGRANCGHSHADALSLDLTAHGCPLFIDPGTFGYTVSSEDRDHFRATATHNTLTIENAWSSIPAGAFSWETRTDAMIDTWWTSASFDYCAGSHRGYERIAPGAVHQRRILFVKFGYWIIWDTIVAPRTLDVAVHFHTAQGTRVIQTSGHASWLERTHRGRRVQVLLAAFGGVGSVDWGSDWVSDCYGRRTLAPVCHISGSQAERRDLISIVVPAAIQESIDVHHVETDGGYGIAVHRPASADLVTLRTGTILATQSLRTDAEMAWIRRDTVSGTIEAVGMIDGHSLRADDLSLDFADETCVEMRRTATGWHQVSRDGRGTPSDTVRSAPTAEVR